MQQTNDIQPATPPRLSYERVAAAAQQLLDEGVELSQITAARLRTRAGHGGNTTWHRHLQRWKALQQEADAAQVAAALPEHAQRAGQQLVTQIWSMALAEARAGMVRERDGFSAQAIRWQQEQQTVLAELAAAEQACDTAQAACATLQQAQTTLAQQLAEAQQQQQWLKAEKKALAERHRGLRQQFNQQQQLTAGAEARAQLAEKQALASDNRLAAQQQENTQLKLACEGLNRDLRHQQQRLSELQAAREAQAEHEAQLQARLNEALQQLAAARALNPRERG